MRFAPLLPLLLAAAPPPPVVKPSPLPPLKPAEFDNQLAIGGKEVAAKKVRTRMTVAVRVNGSGPHRFVVDSGADSSVIGQRLARTLGLPPGSPAFLHGMTASATVQRVVVDQLQLGDSMIANLELPVLREVDLGGDGMLGIDALVAQRLMMDFDKRIITVEDASVPPPKLDGEIVVVARLRRGQLILTRVTAVGQPVEAVVDTGSELTIGNRALRDKLIRRYREKLPVVALRGVTGVTVELELARISELRLGPVTLRDVPVAFADVPPFAAFGLADKPSLLLGTDLMETFRRVSLDFRARKVRFQLRKCGRDDFAIGTGASLTHVTWVGAGNDACRR